MSNKTELAAIRLTLYEITSCISKINGVLIPVVYGAQYIKELNTREEAIKGLDAVQIQLGEIISSLKVIDEELNSGS